TLSVVVFYFFQAEGGIRYFHVTGVQTCALPIYFVRITRSPGSMPSRSATAPQTSVCSLLDSQVPCTAPSVCSCRKGVAPRSGRKPERATRRGTGRSRTYVPEPERPSTSPSAISTLRASSATVSETPYSSRILAWEGRRVC